MDLDANESFESRKLLRFCTAEVNLRSEDLVSPCSGPADKQVAGGGRKEIMSHDEDIFTLNVDGEALEEEMECEPKDETAPDADRVRTISYLGQPCKRNVRSRRRHMRNTEAGALHV